MAIDAVTALIFLPFVVPIGIWVAWSDMKFMKIPNKAVMVLFGIFALVGLIALPIDVYLWRWVIAIGVLTIGFVLNIARAMGAGDAKFLAAMAPFADPGDVNFIVMLMAAMLLAAFATHRLFRAIPGVRARFPDWESWTHAKFPMGLALGTTIILYLALGSVFGS